MQDGNQTITQAVNSTSTVISVDNYGCHKFNQDKLFAAIADFNCYDNQLLQKLLFDVSILIGKSDYVKKYKSDMWFRLNHIQEFIIALKEAQQ
jgi:hypothetical protein